ncbi:UPF0147 family protein [Candidatus Woesearchaeota archaeon]|nr:UPF0147 family protein [Candidatus Woesearchaeota archaeon]
MTIHSPSIDDALSRLHVLINEEDSGKAFCERAAKVISLLQSNTELAVEKALLELEDLNMLDLPSYLRTQIWDVVSLLESAKK